jgi:adenylate cyclase
VIAGEIGSGALGYTAVGEQVGMAQRMESVAPAGGVQLSETTAKLVENTAALSEPRMVQIKGLARPVLARCLIAMASDRHRHTRLEPKLPGRTLELNTVAGILHEAVNGARCVVGVVGPPGIGESRLVRETAVIAADRGIDVITTYCESHTSDIPFHAVARLLRGA